MDLPDENTRFPAGSDIERILAEDGCILRVGQGVSMLPLLKPGKNLVRIEAVHGRCSRGDVVLFTYGEKQYLLHRVVRVNEKDYTICGDNCVTMEEGIPRERIIGRMTAFVRDTRGRDGRQLKWVSIRSPWYRCYSAFMVCFLRPRRFLLRVFPAAKRRVKEALKPLIKGDKE